MLSQQGFAIATQTPTKDDIVIVDVSEVRVNRPKKARIKLFKQTNPNLTYAKFILADSGYQGIQHLYKQAFTPLKQTKKYPLVQEAKDDNTLLSKT